MQKKFVKFPQKKTQNLLISLQILLITLTKASQTFKNTLINDDIPQDMLKSCILAYPSPSDSKKREICLLRIKKIQSSTINFNKHQTVNARGSYNIRKDSYTDCLSLNSSSTLSLQNCELKGPNNTAQKWVFEILQNHLLIKNLRYGKCLTLSITAAYGDPFLASECDFTNIDQHFTFLFPVPGHNHVLIQKVGAVNTCLKILTLDAGHCDFFTHRAKIFTEKIIYNPFFKKCVFVDQSMKVVSRNCGQRDFYFFEVYLIDPYLNKIRFLRDDLFSIIEENGELGFNVSVSENSFFYLENLKEEFFMIQFSDLKCITVDAEFFQEGGELLLETCGGFENQIWMFIDF